MSECHFFLSIHAPQGLHGIEKHMHACKLPLEPYVSGFNGKTILRDTGDYKLIEWHMDSSNTDLIVANGNIFLSVDEAWELLESLCLVLRNSGYPHKIGLDDEFGNSKYESSYLWDKA